MIPGDNIPSTPALHPSLGACKKGKQEIHLIKRKTLDDDRRFGRSNQPTALVSCFLPPVFHSGPLSVSNLQCAEYVGWQRSAILMEHGLTFPASSTLVVQAVFFILTLTKKFGIASRMIRSASGTGWPVAKEACH
jgi:hypothetical protein